MLLEGEKSVFLAKRLFPSVDKNLYWKLWTELHSDETQWSKSAAGKEGHCRDQHRDTVVLILVDLQQWNTCYVLIFIKFHKTNAGKKKKKVFIVYSYIEVNSLGIVYLKCIYQREISIQGKPSFCRLYLRGWQSMVKHGNISNHSLNGKCQCIHLEN